MSTEFKSAIWAHCPHCPEKAHTAVFPIQVTTQYEIDWETAEVSARFVADTRALKQHVSVLHPDKVKADAGVCT